MNNEEQKIKKVLAKKEHNEIKKKSHLENWKN